MKTTKKIYLFSEEILFFIYVDERGIYIISHMRVFVINAFNTFNSISLLFALFMMLQYKLL